MSVIHTRVNFSQEPKWLEQFDLSTFPCLVIGENMQIAYANDYKDLTIIDIGEIKALHISVKPGFKVDSPSAKYWKLFQGQLIMENE